MTFSKAKFIERARWWALSGDLGYDQSNRWDFRVGGEVDCSSFVISLVKLAGGQTGTASFTGNMSAQLCKYGWRRVAANGSPQAGDILLNDVHHVAVYLGGGKLAQASIGDGNRASGGASGDQTNYETNVKNYYNFPWSAYLRYVSPEEDKMALSTADIQKIAHAVWYFGINDVSGTKHETARTKLAWGHHNTDLLRTQVAALQKALTPDKKTGFSKIGDALARHPYGAGGTKNNESYWKRVNELKTRQEAMQKTLDQILAKLK
jgi:hypothetical protein